MTNDRISDSGRTGCALLDGADQRAHGRRRVLVVVRQRLIAVGLSWLVGRLID
jgi:hypothetical protein